MPTVDRTFQLVACWAIALCWHFSCATMGAQNSTSAISSQQKASQAVQPQAGQRSDLDEILSKRLHELFGTPSGEKPNFVTMPSRTYSDRLVPTPSLDDSAQNKTKAEPAVGGVVEKTEDYQASMKQGDVSKGIILLEEKDALYLTRPCKNEILTFHNPYTKKRTGSTNCNGKSVDIYLVSQQ